MNLPPGRYTPTEVADWCEALISATFVANGIHFRVLVELEKTPKPWPDNIRRARNALLMLHNVQRKAYLDVPQEIRAQVSQGTAP